MIARNEDFDRHAFDSRTLRDCFENLYRPHRLLGCSPETIRNYRVQLGHFDAHLGRLATTGDLADGTVLAVMQALSERGLAAVTVNEFRKRIVALWNFLARKRVVQDFPEVQRFPEPSRMPIAWTRESLAVLFAACQRQKGWIAKVPANLWWHGLHSVLWDSGERISAALKLQWNSVDLASAWAMFPAEIRKGQHADAGYSLHETTVELLRAIREYNASTLVFPWDRSKFSVWTHYKQLREDAGLPTDSKSSFHRMRRSVASYLDAAGVDASRVLGHSSSQITRKHYIDERISKPQQAADVLFRP